MQSVVLDFEKKKTEIRFRRLAQNVVDFVSLPEFNGITANGLQKFMSEVLEEAWTEFEENPHGLENEFMEWLILDYEDDIAGVSIAQTYLDSADEWELEDWEMRSLEQWARSVLAVYEVQEIVSDDRVILRDMVGGDVYHVIAPGIGVGLLRWSAMLTRLLAVDDLYTLGAATLIIPRPLLRYVLRIMGHVYRTLRFQGYDGDWQSFLKASTLSLRKLVRVMMMAWGMQESDDGAETYYRGYVGPSDGSGSESQAQAARARKLYRSVIRVSDGERALDAVIRGGSGIRVIGSGAEGGSTMAELAWIRQLEESDLSGVAPYSTNDVALIMLEGDAFTVYAETRSALGTCASVIRKNAAGYLIPRQRGERVGSSRGPGEGERSHAHARIDRIVREAIMEHYRDWADSPLSVLKGESPRNALAAGIGQKVVEGLLKDIEYHENFKRCVGLPWVDVEGLWHQVLSAQGSDGKLTAREHSVVGLLDEMMRMDGYTEDQIFATAKMWYDYVLSASPNVVHAKTWAAAVEYAQAVSEDEPVTQASVAQKYKVSVSTLSQRYREILGSLSANR